jgi:hypothetical protein
MKPAAIVVALALVAACQATPPAPAVRSGPEMPAGSGASSGEVGFSAWCAANPGKGVCP